MLDLTIINRALANTGNETLVVQNDGSDEGNVAEASLIRAKDFIVAVLDMTSHTKTAALVRSGAADLPPYVHAMQYPPDCWHLKDVLDSTYGVSVQHRIVAGRIQTYVDTGILAWYVTNPTVTQNWHPLAGEALTILVESGILRGLNEDLVAADKRWQDGEAMLARAGGRIGQQDTKRNVYRGASSINRRTRKA